jgi:hypothetical protein
MSAALPAWQIALRFPHLPAPTIRSADVQEWTAALSLKPSSVRRDMPDARRARLTEHYGCAPNEQREGSLLEPEQPAESVQLEEDDLRQVREASAQITASA